MYIHVFTQASLYVGNAPMYSTNFGFKNICKNPFVLDVHRLVLLVIIPPVVQSHNCLRDEVSYVIQGWFKVYRKYCAVVYKSATSAPENSVRRKPGTSILWILRDDCNDLTLQWEAPWWTDAKGTHKTTLCSRAHMRGLLGWGWKCRGSLCAGVEGMGKSGERGHLLLRLVIFILFYCCYC